MRCRTLLAAVALAAVACGAGRAPAQKLLLKDGSVLVGKLDQVGGIAETPDKQPPQAGQVPVRPILIVDDELRRTFVPKFQVQEILDGAPEQLIRISPWQNVAHGGGKLLSVGPAINITPFDKYGRRIYEMIASDGPLAVVQGISELTPRYAKVEGLYGQPRVIVWDMRLATSSIPAETLTAIINQAVDQSSVEARLQVVRFYAQGERYHEARRELERLVADFPDQAALQDEVKLLRRLGAERVLREIKLRKAAGQHQLVAHLLESYPAQEVSGATLQQVRELATEYENDDNRIARIAAELRRVVAAIADPDNRGIAAPVAEEVIVGLTHNNVGRLVPFVQLLDDPELSAEEKTALAITGWMLGPEEAETNLTRAVELVKVRDAVLRYLREQQANGRQAILDSLGSYDAATVDRLAKLIATMIPPWHDPKYVDPKNAGDFVIGAPGLTEDGDFRYHVQLPPEYDPTRRYPLIVALNGQYNDPTDELEYWAGRRVASAEGQPAPPRSGQAMRHGYITIAPLWLKPQQLAYEYSGREHVAVLTCVRDALRRFSADSDRVYLAGHDIGGDAAWDLGQAHPDLWAGVIPIVATAGNTYVRHYWENATHVPFYFVAGELDGRRMSDNAPVLDQYLRHRFDATVIEYLGRGHEPFQDEILHMFDWMGRRSRGAPPEDFECDALRPWDNYFWWIECRDYPEELMVFASEWEARKPRAVKIKGKRPNSQRVMAHVPSASATVWLGPDMVDFDKPIRVEINGRRATPAGVEVTPTREVLLEDVRTRGDRQHPFWAKVDWPS
ncbi:MAG: hypothetical protein KDA44_01920 [Planctomycetales bacterium]|nr:hypothetical protein [Planctomycetales bacterium]